ncbi:MAG: ribosome recycling factor [Candidatus Paceibacterota bacterium]
MTYDFSEFKKQINETRDWLANEFSSIRTGQASVGFLDGIKIDSYGTTTPLSQVASLSTEDARTIRISPWDTSQISDIEKAIVDAGLGVSVSTDEKGLRVNFPQLTEETRGEILKVAKGKYEEARVALRTARDEVWSDIQEKEREGDISEDDKFRLKEEMQKIVDEGNKTLDILFEKKEKEIRGK